jgi:hypothetical protein
VGCSDCCPRAGAVAAREMNARVGSQGGGGSGRRTLRLLYMSNRHALHQQKNTTELSGSVRSGGRRSRTGCGAVCCGCRGWEEEEVCSYDAAWSSYDGSRSGVAKCVRPVAESNRYRRGMRYQVKGIAAVEWTAGMGCGARRRERCEYARPIRYEPCNPVVSASKVLRHQSCTYNEQLHKQHPQDHYLVFHGISNTLLQSPVPVAYFFNTLPPPSFQHN